jgi:hypothetical protein
VAVRRRRPSMYGMPERRRPSVLPTRPRRVGPGSGASEAGRSETSTKYAPTRADTFEVLGHLVRGTRQRCDGRPVELLGDQYVLGDLDRVLEHPVDVDDVYPDELASAPDGLGGDLADVRDELQLQVVRLVAALARAQVGRDVLPLDMEGPVHGSWQLEESGRRFRHPPTCRPGERERRRHLRSRSGRSLGTASMTFASSRAVLTSACARLIRCDPMYAV